MSQQGGETGIPVLTEVIVTPVYGVDTPERRAWPRPPQTPPPVPAGATEPADADTAATSPWPDRAAEPARRNEPLPLQSDRVDNAADDTAAFDRIVASVRTQVLQAFRDQTEAMLEQRIRDSLAEHLEATVTQLTAQLREGLQATLDEMLTAAIATELANRRITKN